MRKTLIVFCALAAAGAAAFWLLTEPRGLSAHDLPAHAADPENGRYVFYSAGCASCHAAPKAEGEDKLRLAGGLRLKTPFGTFVAPNISPDPADGIGRWSDLDFANAVLRGVSPAGGHYYPAFPYLSYQRMPIEDVLDLKAFLDTLPAVAGTAPPHELPLPFRLRRGLGLWKRLFMDYRGFEPDPGASDQVNRGAYLVTGPGHCGECHTPRSALGGPKADQALAGAPDPEGGKNPIPNITPSEDGIGGWSEAEIATALKTGLLPEFETFGGMMTKVQENMAHLTGEDLAAIAAYLKTIPPVPDAAKR